MRGSARTIRPVPDDRFFDRLRQKTLDRLGYTGRKQANSAETQAAVDDILAGLKEVLRPRAMYRVLPVRSVSKDGITTEAGIIRSPMLARLAGLCEGERRVVFAIVTLGKAFDTLCNGLDSLYRRYVTDTAGSECIELAADLVEQRWREGFRKEGCECSLRFSPGYCDWALEGQGVIFSALKGEKIGVTLTSHFVMLPVKSVSAVSLVGEKVPVTSPCIFCGKKDCPWRRVP